MIVGQGHIALAVGVGGGGLDIFSLVYFYLSPSLRDDTMLTDMLSERAGKPKTTYQPKLEIVKYC